MDPLTALTLIGSGLALVDQFYDMAKRWKGDEAGGHSVTVDTAEDKLVITDHGFVDEVSGADIELTDFDQVRHDALFRRININWTQYNEIYIAHAAAAADERARLGVQMTRLEEDLCPDFRELVGIYEGILQRSLPDHYTLRNVCA